jgi:hypothetical protein
MSSYCDINTLINDDTNHPNFTQRLDKWRSGPNGTKGCTIETDTKSSGECLTDNELACYSSYQLASSRQELDASLADIYQPQNSISATFDSNYQTTMLTGIVWAALGTTVLYYAFTKI